MKKNIRIFAIFTLIVLSLSMLSSCNLIDEMKEQRFEWKNEKHDIVEYKGKEYKKIESKKDVSINESDFLRGYIVEKDIPLLLIDSAGTVCYYDEALGFLMCEYGYYCTEEKYDEYTEKIENAVLDHYKIDYEYFDYEKEEYVEIEAILDKKVTDLINGTLDNVVGKEMKDEEYYSWDYVLGIDKCDKDAFIHEVNILELCYDSTNGSYGIRAYDEDTGSYIFWEFPEEHENVIKELFDEYYKMEVLPSHDISYQYFPETELSV